jgi:subtilisin family serine protease
MKYKFILQTFLIAAAMLVKADDLPVEYLNGVPVVKGYILAHVATQPGATGPITALFDSPTVTLDRVEQALSIAPTDVGPCGQDWQVLRTNMTTEEALAKARSTIQTVTPITLDDFEPDYIYTMDGIGRRRNASSDPMVTHQWYLDNTSNYYLGTSEAWNTTTGNQSNIVAVLDTGLDRGHPDFVHSGGATNVWQNPTTPFTFTLSGGTTITCPADPKVFGYNAIDNTFTPHDEDGHGTLCAGIIGAVGDNKLGISGVAWQVTLLPCKIFGEDGQTSDDRLDNAIQFILAVNANSANSVKVVSCSFGTNAWSAATQGEFKRLHDAGILVVASAGNGFSDDDIFPHYPSGYEFDNIVTVAASDNDGNLSDSSNFGPNTVDICAPGEDVLSTSLNGDYDTFDGSSAAAAFVAGAAALTMSVPHPTGSSTFYSYADVKAALITLAKHPSSNSLSSFVLSGGLLDVNSLVNGTLSNSHKIISRFPDTLTGQGYIKQGQSLVLTITLQPYGLPSGTSPMSNVLVTISGETGATLPTLSTPMVNLPVGSPVPLTINTAANTTLGEYTIMIGSGSDATKVHLLVLPA